MRNLKSFAVFLFILSIFTSRILSCGHGGSSGPSPNPGPSPTPNPTCSSTQRSLIITNSTNEHIWVGVTGGSLPCDTDADCPTGATGTCAGADPSTQKAGHCSCTSDSQCGSQAVCNTTNSICYMDLPDLTTAQVSLSAGSQSTICVPAPVTGARFQWSGNIFARTGCDSNGQHCQTGDCNASSEGICPAGTGGNPPTALAEFTLSNQSNTTSGPDYYDISIINGINVGVSMSPVANTFTPTSGDSYSCGSPGSTTAFGSLAACNWTINATSIPNISPYPTDQSTLLRNVYPVTASSCGSGSPNSLGYCSCTSNSDCTGGTVCGLAENAASGVQYKKVCGNQVGWWTADQICKSSNNTSPDIAAFNCGTATNLMACTNANAKSCYNNTATAASDCCGCGTSDSSPYKEYWPEPAPGFGGSDNGCYGYNNNWFDYAQNWIVFLKQACPTAYTYPFDDATSTFTCEGKTKSAGPNYNITFLPTH